MREIKKIIVHCSMSSFGDAELINKWHLERGWRGIGYHFVILNGCRELGRYRLKDDGVIEKGRDIEIVGAHCKGHNKDSIGICLIGNYHFSLAQFKALVELIKKLKAEYGDLEVYGHRDFCKYKTCPNFEVRDLKAIFGKF